jgi:hypothetical protein
MNIHRTVGKDLRLPSAVWTRRGELVKELRPV